MSEAIDTALLAMEFGTIVPEPGADPIPLKLMDGFVPTDAAGKVLKYPLPYAVYYSSLGDAHSPRLSGGTTRAAVFFSITYVGLTPTQAKLAGRRIRNAIEGLRLVLGDSKTWLIGLEESQRVRRDDDMIRADGKPVFYGVDNYAVSLTKPAARPVPA